MQTINSKKSSLKVNKNGYVLILSLMVIGVSMALIATVYNRFFVYQDSIRVFIDKEQARLLARSGIQIALSQVSLALPVKKSVDSEGQKNKNGDKSQKKELSPEQKWLMQVLPVLNKWQTINFKDKDDIEGSLQIYISAENGKINLNQFIDREKIETNTRQDFENQSDSVEANQKTEKDKEKTIQKTSQEKKVTKEKVESVLSEILKSKLQLSIDQRVKSVVKGLNRALISPTEIISEKIKKISEDLFVEPNKNKDNNFMDLFTVFTESFKLNPWVLSKSTAKTLGLKPLVLSKESGTNIKEIIKNFKPKLNLETDFDAIFKKIYGKDLKSLGKVKEVLMADFDIDALSVTCYAKVGNVTQAIYAILERERDPKGYSKNSYIFNIKRIYWI